MTDEEKKSYDSLQRKLRRSKLKIENLLSKSDTVLNATSIYNDFYKSNLKKTEKKNETINLANNYTYDNLVLELNNNLQLIIESFIIEGPINLNHENHFQDVYKKFNQIINFFLNSFPNFETENNNYINFHRNIKRYFKDDITFNKLANHLNLDMLIENLIYHNTPEKLIQFTYLTIMRNDLKETDVLKETFKNIISFLNLFYLNETGFRYLISKHYFFSCI